MQNFIEQAEVIDLSLVREKRLKAKTKDEYNSYLDSLTVTQLEIEAHHLLEEFSNQNYGDDYPVRVQLLLNSMADRAEGSFKSAIQHMSRPFGACLQD